jgi:putative transposase
VAFAGASREESGAGPAIRALRLAGVAISPSGYYAARSRPPSARALRDAALEKEIARVYKESGERYGARKVHGQLAREGIPAARCTVERLMRRLGLRGVRRGGYKVTTANPDPSQDRPPDRVRRQFGADAPDRLWVVDFTCVATWEGTAYTALVIDAFARLIPGWRTAASHTADLVPDALVMAVACRARQGVKVAGLIHHSDAGCRVPVHPVQRRAGRRADHPVGRQRRGLLRQRARGDGHRPVQDRGHSSPGAMGNHRPGRGRHRRMGQLVQHPAADGADREPPAGRVRAGLARRHSAPGGEGRRRPWPPLITPGRAPPAPAGAPPRTPALLRDGPEGQGRGTAAGHLPADPSRRYRGTPAPGQGRLRRRCAMDAYASTL